MQTPNDEEKTLEERYSAMIWDLVENQGFTKRKARRYLESQAKRATKKIVNAGKKRQLQLRKEGKIIDTSDISAQFQEFNDQLSSIATDNSISSYKPPTKDF